MIEKEYVIPEIYFSKKAAEHYDKNKRMKKIQKEMTERALELLDLSSGKILDAGCGTGFSTRAIKEKGFNVIGIDVSKPMIEIAARKNLSVLKADFTALPFKEKTFDGLISISSLQWIYGKSPAEVLKKYEKTAKEFYRVLKEKGKAVVQFYPKTEKEFDVVINFFRKAGFKIRIAIDYPEIKKKRKTYIILEKQ